MQKHSLQAVPVNEIANKAGFKVENNSSVIGLVQSLIGINLKTSPRLIKNLENSGFLAMSKQFSALIILLNVAVVATVVKHAVTTAHVVIIVAIKPVQYFDSLQ